MSIGDAAVLSSLYSVPNDLCGGLSVTQPSASQANWCNADCSLSGLSACHSVQQTLA
jgi:hypothetical protein